ncbi:hypothetical protein JIN84_12990 [Luteolibacter yonseiensis]|uniref:Uncharacterized protein n=1 Tax=Luteolibacter yonseiensis TaxID=1144680 RepID=A0A934R7A7_9BACT|nr:hypothetical protein [Luteolibacter yonseiensis]MBK1816535.1 hypothetical protein [Luteolibacter yonseiensis]
MAGEPIYNQRRQGFPKESRNATSYLTTIEYVGLHSDLRSASPPVGSTWGDYPGIVSDLDLSPLEGTESAILTVVVELKFSNEGQGELQESNEEIEWASVSRSMYEHPEFSINGSGSYKLTSEDIAAIKKWQEMPDVAKKKDYKYYKGDKPGDGEETLSSHAKMFARGIELGVEYYVDKAPVARLTQTYVNGPGPTSKCGEKDTPSVSNIPSGYEWVRETDSSVRSGEDRKWTRRLEWMGADKVLVDVKDIYWTSP